MEIKEIEKVSLNPHDIVLIRFDIEDYSFDDMNVFYEHLSQNIFQSNNVLCLPTNMDFSILSQEKFPDIKKYFGDF